MRLIAYQNVSDAKPNIDIVISSVTGDCILVSFLEGNVSNVCVIKNKAGKLLRSCDATFQLLDLSF